MRFISLQFALLAILGEGLARPGFSNGPASRPHSLARPAKRSDGISGCKSGADVGIKSAKKNIFSGLTDKEYVDVTAYLHAQKKLNLTAIVNSTA
jgi:primary-amine oxidase